MAAGGGWDDGGRHGWDNDGWRGNRGNYYRRHHYRDWDDDDNGAGVALGLFGFAAGALVGSQLYGGQGYGGGGYDAHDAACARRFRSYDPYSNTYMGYDGYRHYC